MLEALRDSLVLAALGRPRASSAACRSPWLFVRYPGRWSSLTERLLYVVYAIPGICLALGVVSFTLNVMPSLYQTLLALVVAVSLRYLIQPVGALRGPILQVSPRTLDAARSLGEAPIGVARTITLPLLRPGLLAGARPRVPVSALKELPAHAAARARPASGRSRRSSGTRLARPSSARPRSLPRSCSSSRSCRSGCSLRRGDHA